MGMGSKQWMAVVQLVTGPAVLLWLVLEHSGDGIGDGSSQALARTLLWVAAGVVLLNIVGMILVALGVSVIRREAFRDEPADERDDAIDARASRIGYAVTSILAAVMLIPLALGAPPQLSVAMLFLAPMGGGLAHAAAVLVLYR